MINKTYSAIATSVLMASSFAMADSYNVQLNVGHERADLDNTAGSTKTEAVARGATFYFSPVDTTKGPLAEAAFLDKASGITLVKTDSEVESVESDVYSGRLSVVDKDTGFLFAVSLENGEANNLDSDSLGLRIGQYIDDNSTVAVNYENASAAATGDVDTWSIDYSTFIGGDIAYRIDAEVGYVVDNGSLFALGGTAYPSNDLGVGVSFHTVDLNSGAVDTWTIDAEWFINEAVSVSAFYKNENQDGDWEIDGYGVAAGLRF